MSEFTHYEIGLLSITSWLLEQSLRVNLQLAKYQTGKQGITHHDHQAMFEVDGVNYRVRLDIKATDESH